MSLRVDDVLGPSSPLRRALEGYEDRPGQLAMAQAVEDALRAERALVVEAGTGTGKTLAYLVPAVLSGRKVVVSTATRALQEQIFFKDLPLLREVLGALGVTFTASMMKGLSNYLCKRRLDERLASGEDDLGLVRIRRWAADTDSGDRAELASLRDDDPAWLAAQSSTDTRIGADCKYYDECFVTRMKRDAEQADLVIVNHHLFCADLALRRGPRGEYAGAIPPHDAVIFDEAHQLEDVATAFFGSRVSSARVAALVRDAQRTLASRKGTELLAGARPVFELVLEASDRFFSALASRAEPGARRGLRPRNLSPEVEAARLRLDACLEGLARTAGEDGDPARAQIARRATELRAAIRLIVLGVRETEDGGEEELARVAWIEAKDRSVVIGQSPVDLAPDLADALFSGGRTVVCTSATLATPGPRGAQSFGFLRRRLGVPEEARDLVVPSPFDFASRAGLYVARDLPEPQDPAFEEAAADRIGALLEVTGGGAFVLTTSLRSMRALHARLRRSTRLPLMLQGERPKSLLLSRFREARHAVLVATMSFWEGVDVPGHALRLVVLDKVPFAVPTDPVVAARCEAMERQGQSAFYGYSVPAAAITLKQGFGRLIRTRRDAGIVALLDRRAATKAYGRALLQSLPPARRLEDMDAVRAFYAEVFPGDEP